MTNRRRALWALLVSGLALLGLEGAVRLLGVAQDDRLISPLLFQQPLGQPLALDAPGGWKILVDGPRRQAQPPGLRALVVGGSAADGVGVSPFGGFSHQLERRLVQARPSRPVEVVNLARAGLGSRQVAAVLDGGLADLTPELVILYSGNNELHELRALKHAAPHYRANLERTRRRLHGLHSYRLLQSLLGRDRLEPMDAHSPKNPGLPDLPTWAEADDRALARQLYRENLLGMIRSSRAAGARVLLCTVADNRADWAGESQRELSPEEGALVDDLALALEGDQAERGAALMAQLVDGDPSQAALFRAGRAALATGRVEQARTLLDLAELYDGRPTRSNAELRAVVRELAQAEGVGLCDIAAGLDALAPRGVAGDEHFTDGCHLNTAGQRAVAALLEGCIQDMGLATSAAELGALERDPFRLDHDLRDEGEGFPPLSPADPPGLQATREGHLAFAAGDLEGALEHYQRAMEQGAPPGSVDISLAIVHWHRGELQRARALLADALEQTGDDPELSNLAAVLRRRSP